MVELLKKNWLYSLIVIFLIVLSIFDVANLKYGFFTAYDEAYFLLKLKEGYTLSSITGKSQWNLIAVHWFPYMDLTSKINSYLATEILIWFSVLVMTATCCVLFRKKSILRYFSLIFLFYFLITRNALSYITMHTAVVSWGLCCFVLFHFSHKKWAKIIFAALCGICMGLDCFIYIPAALSVLGCIVLVIVLAYWKDKKTMLLSLLSGIAGIGMALAYFQLFVCSLKDVFNAMLFTAGYIGKSGYSYDSSSIIMQYALFFRDYLFVIIAFAGSYYLSKIAKNRYIGTIIYVALLLLYTHYQADPSVTPTMFLISLVLIPLISSHPKNCYTSAFGGMNIWVFLFLLLFPFAASMGTNTDLGGRIACFTFSWLFLLFYKEAKENKEGFNRVLIAAIILSLIPLADVVKEIRQPKETCQFTRGNKHFAELYITEKQKDYFDNVYDIMEVYDYQPNKSVVFTALFDYCCLYAFDAVNSSNFHQIQNFHFFDKEQMLKPDFIFLCPWDSTVVAEELKALPWGWPEDFDAYFVGSPEPDDAPWVLSPSLEQRTLYCRKKKAVEPPEM